MKIIRRNLLKIIASAMLVTALIVSTTFGGTYAWFVKQFDPEEAENQMGEVKVGLTANATKATITNDSTIDIILRVRVIVEPDIPATGVPKALSDSAYLALVNVTTQGWLKVQSQDGIFFVYSDKTSVADLTGDYKDYKPVEPSKTPITFTYTAPTTDYTVTFIAEALQATETAYDYTTTTPTPSGVTSWKLN